MNSAAAPGDYRIEFVTTISRHPDLSSGFQSEAMLERQLSFPDGCHHLSGAKPRKVEV
jgi:hypothetical protein